MQPFEQQLLADSVHPMVFSIPWFLQQLLWDTYEIAIGFDGSVVSDGEYVYVLPLGEVMQIDYFHGCIENRNGIRIPVCQMMDEDESNFVASELIALQRGFVADCIINVQRRWRRLRAERLVSESARSRSLSPRRGLGEPSPTAEQV